MKSRKHLLVVIKLLDFQAKIQELKTSNNPFAAVFLAQLAAMKGSNQKSKLINKITLTKGLYHRGWSKEDILSLYEFIDWVVALPEEFELEYEEELDKFEKEQKMEYVTTAERIGIRKGERNILVHLLQQKFASVPTEFLQKIEKANSQDLLFWGGKILKAESFEEIFCAPKQ